MAEISDEMVSDFVRLYRRGESYRAIGKNFKVDPRTVKARILKVETEGEDQHWEAVARRLDSKYLHEHNRLLWVVAQGVLDAVQREPLFAGTDQQAQIVVKTHVEYRLREYGADLLEARGMDLASRPQTASPDRFRSDPVERFARRLLAGLMEHEPQLEKSLEEWGERWSGFQNRRVELAAQVEGIYKGRGVGGELANVLGRGVAHGAMSSSLLDLETEHPHAESGETGETSLTIKSDLTRNEEHSFPTDDVKLALDQLELVSDQVAHEERMGSVREAYALLKETVHTVEDHVDELVLKGKLRGKCTLCPDGK